jgi:asparagine N-glycosylation enzyme membrane subunit Stt3
VVAGLTDRSDATQLPRPLVAALLTALTITAFAFRVIPALAVVFPSEGEVRLLGFDAYYHLRHAEYAAKHFPEIQRWDVGTHYPHGQRSDAAGLFDLTIAAVAIASGGGAPDEEALFRAAAWLPPVLLLLAFPVLYAYARHWLDARWSLLACAVFLLSPGLSLSRTMLGFADHHVAEILLALVSAAGLARVLSADPHASPLRRWLTALGAALPMALFAFTWVGAPIFLLLLCVAVLMACLLEIARGRHTRAIGLACFRYAIALLAWLVAAAIGAPMLVMEPRIFPLLVAGCAALALGALALTRTACALIDRGRNPVSVAAGTFGCALLVGGALLLAYPPARDLVWLVLAVKTNLVAEHEPVSLARFWQLFGPAGVLAGVGVALGARAAWRQRDGRRLIPIALATLWVALWCRTHDYGYLPPPFLAVAAAIGASELLTSIRPARVRTSCAAVLFGLLLFPIWPAEQIRRPIMPVAFVRATREIGDGCFEAMRWLRAASPEPTVPVDARVPAFGPEGFAYPDGSYGIVSTWGFGSFVAAVGRRPPVWSRGSDNDPTAAWLMGEYDPSSPARLCPPCRGTDRVRYVVITARDAAHSYPSGLRQAGLDPDLYRDANGSIQLATGRDGRELAIPRFRLNDRFGRTVIARLFFDDGRGIGGLRMVYESPHRSWVASVYRPGEPRDVFRRRAFPIDLEADRAALRPSARPGNSIETIWGYAYDGIEVPSVKIFEVVQGARLVGSAPGALEIEAQLELQDRTSGRRFEYRTRARPTPEGRFELIVPYATREPDPGTPIAALGSYAIRVVKLTDGAAIPARSADVALDQIRSGGAVELGSIRIPASPGSP